MASAKALRVAELLIDLEAVLRNLNCWDLEPPVMEVLESREPFCVDTMEFYQWLQWIFIPRIYHNLEMNLPLPEQCNIVPIAEEWVKMRAFTAHNLMGVLFEIDSVLSEGNQ